MPVKVRCRSCQKVLNAPDRARGKAIKCPNCADVVRVPAGEGKPSGRKSSGVRVPGGQAPEEGDVESVLANIDLRHAEDKRVRVCPKCGAEVTEEDIDCPECGVDLETGQISERTLRAKGLIGPDPAEFYGQAWSDSGQFVLENKKLVFKTGIYWTFLILLLGGSTFMLGLLYTNYPIGQAPEEGEVLSPFEILFGGKWPLKFFFIALSYLFSAGTLGWYWRLAIEVIRVTMAKRKTIPKVNFDLFEALALGCKVFFWSTIFMLPIFFVASLVVVPVAIVGSFVMPAMTALAIVLIALGIFSIPILVFPVAMVHMSMPYTYKAWLPTEMLKVLVKNIGPALYWLMIFLVVNLPIVGLLLLIGLVSNHLAGFFENTLGSWSTWMLGLVWKSGIEDGFFFQTIRGLLAIFFAFLMISPICFIAAIPAVFTMRANGLLAFYRKESLELIREKAQHEPAGFWVRYLAYLIDVLLLPLTPILVYKNRIALLAIWAYNAAVIVTSLWVPAVFPFVLLAGIFVYGWMYFALSEASPEEGTIGKLAFGMVVLSEKKMKKVTIKQATIRYFGRVLGGIPFGIFGISPAATFGFGFLFSAFTPKKQALHDMMAKTVVVFRGDDDSTTA